MHRLTRFVATGLFILVVMLPSESMAQWSANSGETVRNAFGPLKNQNASACRGACGMDCPSSCEQAVEFECSGAGTFKRVQTYRCGTHQGCRQHDDCLDRCSEEQAEGFDCQAVCHSEAMTDWGPERAMSWAAGGGPFDGGFILFEYTTDTPGGPEAIYRCPAGSRQSCGAPQDGCMSGGKSIDPVFDSFAGNGAGAVQVFGFRSGRVCLKNGQPSSVCETTVDVQVTGSDRCAQSDGAQACSWYGFELDYRNANPTVPLICQSSGADEDFLGGIVSKALETAPADSDTDLGQLLGNFQKELKSGKSLDQVLSGITITTGDGQTLGNPTEKEAFRQPGVPSEVALNGVAGHILVPMFELHNSSPPGTSMERQVRCSMEGQPVIETTFRLHFN